MLTTGPVYKDRIQFNTDYLPTALNNYGFKTDDGDKVDWAKFAMWLRGFLAAVEGQPLTPESVSKIMEKLATVDPDKNLSYHIHILNNANIQSSTISTTKSGK